MNVCRFLLSIQRDHFHAWPFSPCQTLSTPENEGHLQVISRMQNEASCNTSEETWRKALVSLVIQREKPIANPLAVMVSFQEGWRIWFRQQRTYGPDSSIKECGACRGRTDLPHWLVDGLQLSKLSGRVTEKPWWLYAQDMKHHGGVHVEVYHFGVARHF